MSHIVLIRISTRFARTPDFFLKTNIDKIKHAVYTVCITTKKEKVNMETKTKKTQKKIMVYLTEDTHNQLKIISAIEKKTMGTLVKEMVADRVRYGN